MAWGDNFSISVWYVRLRGVTNPVDVQTAAAAYQELREKEAIRLCLKHLRQRNYLDCFERLQKRTKVDLEDAALTDLYELLVTKVGGLCPHCTCDAVGRISWPAVSVCLSVCFICVLFSLCTCLYSLTVWARGAAAVRLPPAR